MAYQPPTVIETDDLQVKIYIKSKNKNYKRSTTVIRIDEDVYDKVIKLSKETQLSITALTSELLRFALERTAVIEEDERTFAAKHQRKE